MILQVDTKIDPFKKVAENKNRLKNVQKEEEIWFP